MTTDVDTERALSAANAQGNPLPLLPPPVVDVADFREGTGSAEKETVRIQEPGEKAKPDNY